MIVGQVQIHIEEDDGIYGEMFERMPNGMLNFHETITVKLYESKEYFHRKLKDEL